MLTICSLEIAVVSIVMTVSNHWFHYRHKHWILDIILEIPVQHIQGKIRNNPHMRKYYSGVAQEILITETVKTIFLIIAWSLASLLPVGGGAVLGIVSAIFIGKIISSLGEISGSLVYEAVVCVFLSINIVIVSGIYDNAVSRMWLEESILASQWNVGVRVIVVFIPSLVLSFIRLFVWRNHYPFMVHPKSQ